MVVALVGDKISEDSVLTFLAGKPIEFPEDSDPIRSNFVPAECPYLVSQALKPDVVIMIMK